MSEARTTSRGKSNWSPTEGAFKKFLTWLDNGTESHGEAYIEMRRRMVSHFVRKGCSNPDELADETLNRVNRRLDEEGDIISETPARYCYIVAKFVLLEHLRSQKDAVIAIDSLPPDRKDFISAAPEVDSERVRKEKMLECLDTCASKLDEANRKLIFGYYFGETSQKIAKRREIAADLGISVNALSIRACRIRSKLEDCVKSCAGNE